MRKLLPGRAQSGIRPGPAPGEPATGSVWNGMRTLVRGRERSIAGLSATAVLAGVAEAGILAVVAQVGTALISGADSVGVDAGPVQAEPTIATLLWLAAGLAVLRVGLLALTALQLARLASDVQARMRTDLFAAYARSSWPAQASDREGHLQELATSQAIQATSGTVQLASLLTSLVTFAVLVASALLLNVVAAVVVVAVALAVLVLLRPLSALGRRSARELSSAQMAFAGGVGEAVRMTEEMHVFGAAEAQVGRIEALAERSRRLFLRASFVSRFVPMLFQSLIYLTVVAGLGAVYATGAGDVGALGAVVLLMVRAGTYGQQIQSSYQVVLQALPFVERIEAARGSYLARPVGGGRRPLPAISALAFRDVSYGYREGAPVLSAVGFEAVRGDAVGIVGPSGAGKSTLMQLLLRLRQPDSGRYEINGSPATEFGWEDWRRQVAYVPQEPRLLHASVAANIRYFRDLDDAAVRRAARLARIDEEIASWRRGYETVIGPRADSISGGQQQRICLARALAAAPDVLVLDEPTSALDPLSETLIQESLAELAAQLTLFVVTHRMTMLAVCDNALVLVGGRVDAFGSADALRRTNRFLSAA